MALERLVREGYLHRHQPSPQELATIVLRAIGYRTAASRSGHHYRTFEALILLLGHGVEAFADYFETCRVKRNTLVYRTASTVSEREVEELLAQADRFRTLIVTWLRHEHPELLSRAPGGSC